MDKDSISKFFHGLRRRPEIMALVPMGYNPGIPALSVRADNLCIEVPYLRYKVTGQKDRTLVYPVRYVATYLVPEFTMVAFTDLAFTPEGADTDYDKPVGHFRHEAIAELTKGEYERLREDTFMALSATAMHMLGIEELPEHQQGWLSQRLQTIVEPSLYPFYKQFTPDFYNRYISHGED